MLPFVLIIPFLLFSPLSSFFPSFFFLLSSFTSFFFSVSSFCPFSSFFFPFFFPVCFSPFSLRLPPNNPGTSHPTEPRTGSFRREDAKGNLKDGKTLEDNHGLCIFAPKAEAFPPLFPAFFFHSEREEKQAGNKPSEYLRANPFARSSPGAAASQWRWDFPPGKRSANGVPEAPGDSKGTKTLARGRFYGICLSAAPPLCSHLALRWNSPGNQGQGCSCSPQILWTRGWIPVLVPIPKSAFREAQKDVKVQALVQPFPGLLPTNGNHNSSKRFNPRKPRGN